MSDTLRAELTRVAAQFGADGLDFVLERPRDAGHGDLATNLAMLLALPHVFPNPYASGPAYDRYYNAARQNHAVMAPVLHWAVQVQPVVYRLGRSLLRIAGR